MRKKILILAKSYKHRKNGEFGKCIAGIINQDGKYRWVRLVADKDGNSVPDSNFPYETLDIVEADIEPCPLNNQIENHTFSNVRKNSSITNEQLKSIFARIPHSFFGSMSNMFDGVPKNSLTIFLASDIRIYWEEKNDKKEAENGF